MCEVKRERKTNSWNYSEGMNFDEGFGWDFQLNGC